VAVRTKLLCHGTTTTSFVTVYTVPSGKTAIVKSIILSNPVGGATQTFYCRQMISGVEHGFLRIALAAADVFSLGYEAPMQPGESLSLKSLTGGGVTFLIGGVELDGVAP